MMTRSYFERCAGAASSESRLTSRLDQVTASPPISRAGQRLHSTIACYLTHVAHDPVIPPGRGACRLEESKLADSPRLGCAGRTHREHQVREPGTRSLPAASELLRVPLRGRRELCPPAAAQHAGWGVSRGRRERSRAPAARPVRSLGGHVGRGVLERSWVLPGGARAHSSCASRHSA